MIVPRLPATASGADVAAALRDNGCAIVERLVAPALLERARAELQPWLAATPCGRDEFSGLHTRRSHPRARAATDRGRPSSTGTSAPRPRRRNGRIRQATDAL